MLHESAQMSRDAIKMVDEDWPAWAYIIASSANVFISLYEESLDPEHLNEAIGASEKAVKCDVGQMFFARRSEMLARQLHSRWILRKDARDHTDLHAAIEHSGNAVNDTPISSPEHARRMILYSDYLVKKSVGTKDLEPLKTLISLRVDLGERLLTTESPEENDEAILSSAYRVNCSELAMAYCWQYGLLASPDILDRVSFCTAKALCEYKADLQDVSAYNAHPVLMIREAARTFQHRQIQNHDDRYKPPLVALETLEMLYKHVWTSLPRIKKSDLSSLSSAVIDLRDAAEDLFDRTGLAKYGWAVDDYNILDAQINVLVMMAERLKDDDPLEEIFGTAVSVGESCVLKRKIVVPGVSANPFDALHYFLDDVKPENYIRKRNEDGTIELGFTDEDKEVSSWYHREFVREK